LAQQKEAAEEKALHPESGSKAE